MKATLNFVFMAADIAFAVVLVVVGSQYSPWLPMMMTGLAGMHLVMGLSYALGFVE